MGAKFDKIQAKLREKDTQDLSSYQTKIDNTLQTTNKNVVGAINEVKQAVDTVAAYEEKIIIENTNNTIYVSKDTRVVQAVDFYNCSDVQFNNTALAVGTVIAANTVYTVTATVSSDKAVIIIRTLPQTPNI